MTIGIVVVAPFAARATVLLRAMIRSTRILTNSAASAFTRPGLPSA